GAAARAAVVAGLVAAAVAGLVAGRVAAAAARAAAARTAAARAAAVVERALAVFARGARRALHGVARRGHAVFLAVERRALVTRRARDLAAAARLDAHALHAGVVTRASRERVGHAVAVGVFQVADFGERPHRALAELRTVFAHPLTRRARRLIV